MTKIKEMAKLPKITLLNYHFMKYPNPARLAMMEKVKLIIINFMYAVVMYLMIMDLI
jgi:hypothetical protein